MLAHLLVRVSGFLVYDELTYIYNVQFLTIALIYTF